MPWGRKGWLHVCFLSSLGRPVTGKGKAEYLTTLPVHLLTSVCLSSIDLCFVVVITPRPLIITAHHTTHRPAPCAACFAAPRAHVDSPLRPRDRRLPTSLLGSGFERTLDLSPSTTTATWLLPDCCPPLPEYSVRLGVKERPWATAFKELPQRYLSGAEDEDEKHPDPTTTSKRRNKRDLWDSYRLFATRHTLCATRRFATGA